MRISQNTPSFEFELWQNFNKFFLHLCNLLQDSCRIPGAYLLKFIHQLPASEANFDNVSEN